MAYEQFYSTILCSIKNSLYTFAQGMTQILHSPLFKNTVIGTDSAAIDQYTDTRAYHTRRSTSDPPPIMMSRWYDSKWALQ